MEWCKLHGLNLCVDLSYTVHPFLIVGTGSWLVAFIKTTEQNNKKNTRVSRNLVGNTVLYSSISLTQTLQLSPLDSVKGWFWFTTMKLIVKYAFNNQAAMRDRTRGSKITGDILPVMSRCDLRMSHEMNSLDLLLLLAELLTGKRTWAWQLCIFTLPFSLNYFAASLVADGLPEKAGLPHQHANSAPPGLLTRNLSFKLSPSRRSKHKDVFPAMC